MGVGVKRVSDLELLQLILNELVELRRDLRRYNEAILGVFIEEVGNR